MDDKNWKKDTVFQEPIDKIVDFNFDEKVANVFEDMLRRSIPGYSTIISIIGMLAKFHARPNSNLYDLGASLGAASLVMQKNISVPGCKIIAVDNSLPMINRCREIIENKNYLTPIELVCADVMDVEIKNASIVVLNFTLQFIPLEYRNKLIEKIYNGLQPGGILILSEKISFDDEDLNKRQIQRYHNFKKFNGYSDLEISAKRDALENVLIPETLDTHFSRLYRARFSYVDLWYQLFNFASIIATK